MTRQDEEARALSAAGGGAEKSDYVRKTFSEIAPRYDLLNHVLSFNIDKGWRRKAIAELRIARRPSGRYLDLCAGTLDISQMLATTYGFSGSVVGADFAEPMLRAGASKVAALRVSPLTADALELPIASGSMSGAIVGFGIRNVADLDAALREVHRVLEPGARFVILEFSTPGSLLINTTYQFYFNHILPAIGRLVSGHRTAYKYLPRSVANFPTTEELSRRMQHAGFVDVAWRSLTFGTVAIHAGEKA